jgi:hypothetical protein
MQLGNRRRDLTFPRTGRRSLPYPRRPRELRELSMSWAISLSGGLCTMRRSPFPPNGERQKSVASLFRLSNAQCANVGSAGHLGVMRRAPSFLATRGDAPSPGALQFRAGSASAGSPGGARRAMRAPMRRSACRRTSKRISLPAGIFLPRGRHPTSKSDAMS